MSVLIDRKIVAMAATGVSLFWSIAMSATFAPRLIDLQEPEYAGIYWIFSLSPTRWYAELYYTTDIEKRPWKELHDGSKLQHGYSYSNKLTAFTSILWIGVGWLLLSLIALKLVNRNKQK